MAAKQTYNWIMDHLGALLAVPLVGVALTRLQELHQGGQLQQFVEDLRSVRLSLDFQQGLVCDGCTTAMYWIAAAVAALLAYALYAWTSAKRKVHLIDFSVYAGDDSWQVSKDLLMKRSEETGKFDEKDMEFQRKIIFRSGLGDKTYCPPWLSQKEGPVTDMEHARLEFEVTCFSAVRELLEKTGVKPSQIGLVVVNSSLFNPTPSLSACIMNHFKMPSNAINYNLGGMGCSAGVIAVDLARQALQEMPNTYALVVSCENLTRNWYPGAQKSMLIPNCIFRANGAAVLLSNKPRDAWRAKYTLQHVVRTMLAADDKAYGCVYEQEDEVKIRGVKLSKELMGVAGRGLKANMTRLGPLVLPLSEKLLFAGHMLASLLLGRKKGAKAYVPDFSRAFQHICIHTGGRAVIDAMEEQLSLNRALIEPSRATLYRVGNVSSTSIWYVLAYIESYGKMRAGDRVWQLSFGSGFKCNSAVWVANRKIKEMHTAWEGFDTEAMWEDLAAMDAKEGLVAHK